MEEAEATELVVALYRTLYAPVLRYAAHLGGTVEVAEDVVQEVFLRLYRTLISGGRVDNCKAWVYCVVRREVVKTLQAPEQVPLAVLDEVPLGDWIGTVPGLERDDVTRMFAVLTKREEDALVLRLAALSYREIAKELGVTVGSVATLLSRATRKLQAFVGRGHAQNATEDLGDDDVDDILRKTSH